MNVPLAASKLRKPSGNLRLLSVKLPPYALVIIYQSGKVENPEFVADYYSGTEINRIGHFFAFQEEWKRWKREVYPNIDVDEPYELWAKFKDEWVMVNPNAVDIPKPNR